MLALSRVEHLALYTAFHRSSGNRLAHAVGVPVVMLTGAVLLRYLGWPGLPHAHLALLLTAALAAAAACVDVAGAVVLAAPLAAAGWLGVEVLGAYPALYVVAGAAALHGAGWALTVQVGHGLLEPELDVGGRREDSNLYFRRGYFLARNVGRTTSRLDATVQFCIAPLVVVLEALFACGWRPRLAAAVAAERTAIVARLAAAQPPLADRGGGGPAFAWGALVDTYQWLRDPERFAARARARSGDGFCVRLVGLPPLVVFREPEAARAILTASEEDLVGGVANRILLPVVGEESLLVQEGAAHRDGRRAAASFVSRRALDRDAARSVAEIAAAQARALPCHEPAPLLSLASRISRDVILRVVLGDAPADTRHAVGRALAELVDEVSPLWLLPRALVGRDAPFGPLRRLRQLLDRRLDALLDDGGPRDGALAQMAQRRGTGCPWTRARLRDQAVTLLLTGHETVALTIAWTLGELVANPPALARLEEELGGFCAEAFAAGEAAFPWLEAVVRETLRLHPALPLISRLAPRPFEVAGITVPAGARAAIDVAAVHRHPSHWPEPDAFRPERFLGAEPRPYAYLPFGGGGRRCLGRDFAQVEIAVAIATLVRRLRLRFAPGYRLRAVRRGVVSCPTDGVVVIAEAR